MNWIHTEPNKLMYVKTTTQYIQYLVFYQKLLVVLANFEHW